jgi:hypothetical protein
VEERDAEKRDLAYLASPIRLGVYQLWRSAIQLLGMDQGLHVRTTSEVDLLPA